LYCYSNKPYTFFPKKQRYESGHIGCKGAFAIGAGISNCSTQLFKQQINATEVFSLANQGDSSAKDIIANALEIIVILCYLVQAIVTQRL
jgi:hypothetical protein